MFLNIIIIIIATYTTWYASEILSKGTENVGKKYNIYEVDGDLVGQQYPSDTGPIEHLHKPSYRRFGHRWYRRSPCATTHTFQFLCRHLSRG